MKIAWLKYSGSLELGCHLVFTQGSQDLRTRLFRELLSNGNEVQVQTPFSKQTVDYLDTQHAKDYFDLDNLTYNPNKPTIDKDTDVLIIESGSDNVRFETTIDGVKMPQQAHVNKVIKGYKGFVIYLQIDVALRFPFFPERLSKDYLEKHIQGCNYRDLFENKNWLVVSPAKDVDEFCKNSNSARFLYSDLKKHDLIKVDRFEFHYCGIDFEEEVYEPQLKTINSLLYIGGERSRISKINKYYNSVSKELKTTIYGKWKDETIKKFPDIDFKGVLGKGKTRELYNQYFASIIIGDVKYEKVKCVSGRFFEVVTANTLPLIDKDLLDTTVSDIFSKELLELLVVGNAKDIIEKIPLHDSEERVFLIQECVDQMKQFSPKTSYDLFIDIVNKYKDNEVTDLDNLDELFLEKQINRYIDGEGNIDEFTEKIYQYHLNK